MHTALSTIHTEIHQVLSGIKPRTRLDTVLEQSNAATTKRFAALVISTMHRGHKLHRVTMADLYSDRHFLNLHDKITSLLITRVIPATPSVRDLLDGHRRDMLAMADRIGPIDREAAAKLRRIANLEKPATPAFFHIVVGTRGVSFKPLRTKDIRAELLRHGIAINGGRHFFVSEAAARDMTGVLLRVITGHGRDGGQPFNFAGGIAPAELIRLAGDQLAHLQAAYMPRSWPSLRHEPVASPLPLLLPKALRIESREDAAPRPGLVAPEFWRRRSDPFNVYTLQHRAFIRHVRARLRAGGDALSPWAAVLVALAIIDGFAWPTRLEEAWQAIATKSLWRLGVSPLVAWKEADGNEWCQPLQPLTSVFLNQALIEEVPPFNICRREAVDWIRAIDSRVSWDPDPQRAFVQLCVAARSSLLVELPPWIYTALSPTLLAASLSISSVARIAYRRPARHSAPK